MKFSEVPEKERVAFVKTKLETNDDWLTRGLVAIYKYQTNEEQMTAATRVDNGVGFSAFDARFLTGMAQLVIDGRNLSQKQIACVRKGMKKYAGQLVRIATV